MSAPSTRELKKGSAELLILSSIEARARHGYDIARWIEGRSDGAVRFHAASLYPLLYRLEKRGLMDGRWVEKAGGRVPGAACECECPSASARVLGLRCDG
jgi:DNA-binding PadR family transcriptional regulator